MSRPDGPWRRSNACGATDKFEVRLRSSPDGPRRRNNACGTSGNFEARQRSRQDGPWHRNSARGSTANSEAFNPRRAPLQARASGVRRREITQHPFLQFHVAHDVAFVAHARSRACTWGGRGISHTTSGARPVGPSTGSDHWEIALAVGRMRLPSGACGPCGFSHLCFVCDVCARRLAESPLGT